MPRAEASIIIHAPPVRVAQLYRDYQSWPQVFPETIRGVRLVRSEPGRTELEIEHREGIVPNVMTDVSPEQIDLWEAKQAYEGSFVNRFEAVPEGSRYTVVANIRLKGAAKLLGPLLGGYIRRQIVRYVLAPMRVAAETQQGAPPSDAAVRQTVPTFRESRALERWVRRGTLMKRRHWLWVALVLGVVALWFLTDAPRRWAEWRRGKAPASTLPDSLPAR